jgi:methionyl-tRNA formyltransferase
MRIVFMGTPTAAVPSLNRILENGHEIAAVWTQPDKPAGRGNKLAASPIKEFALENNLPVFQPAKIKTAESLELFRSHRADVAVVVAYGRILPESYLRAFAQGAINVHFSLLPKYRGAAPVNWAIVNAEEITGVTTMKMDAGLDTGDILLQSEIPIGKQETAAELMQRLSLIGADLLAETLENLDSITPRKQDDSQATLAPIMQKADGLIDWDLTATEILNRVRGFQPFPTSYTNFQGKKLTVWKADVQSSPNQVLPERTSETGTILEAKKDDLLVACRDNTVLQLLELQLEGKRRMTARDFLNGTKLETGEKLG